MNWELFSMLILGISLHNKEKIEAERLRSILSTVLTAHTNNYALSSLIEEGETGNTVDYGGNEKGGTVELISV